MFRRRAATSTNDAHAELFDELAEHLRHWLGLERIDRVASAGIERQPRVGDARYRSRGILRQIANWLAHVFGAGRAIEPDHVDAKRLEGRHRARDIGAEQHSTARIERDLRLDCNAPP